MRLNVFIIAAMLTVQACSLTKSGIPKKKKSNPVAQFNEKRQEVESFNFKTGYPLAVQQDSLLVRYQRGETISEKELLDLKNNTWVKSAKYIAPSNLILRQWGLIDLYSQKPAHGKKILEMMEILSYGPGKELLWAEGYSYWHYTRAVVELWTAVYPKDPAAVKVKAIIDAVDLGFALTAYERNSVWYPAPYGDLRDHPLHPLIQDQRIAMKEKNLPRSCAFIIITKTAEGYKYIIKGSPIGLNSHVPVGTNTVEVKNGMPAEFKFYTGYNKKYASPEEEKADLLHPKRIGSIHKLKLSNRFK